MQDDPKRPRGAPIHRQRVLGGAAASKARRIAARVRDNFKFVTELKLELGCADCGYNAHPAALDFDHLPEFTKRVNISRMMGRTRASLLRELAKCECVCSNCHRIRTYERRRSAGGSPDVTAGPEQLILI